MSLLSPLLEIQDIDRTCDRLHTSRRELPERSEEARAKARIATIDEKHVALQARRADLEKDEHALADQVAEVAAKAKGVEDTLYGGTVTAAKDLATLQDEIASIRVRQGALEEQEMELLEQIDGTEGEMAANRDVRRGLEEELAEVDGRLRSAMGLIDAELADHDREKAGRSEKLPEPILVQYLRLRENGRLNGVAAAPFTEKGCGGCKMQLPRLEYTRMLGEPEDALLSCENCGRLLVR